MTKLMNEIVINVPRDKVWSVLADIELLEQYDPITKLIDLFMVRKKWDSGIKLFFKGLKEFSEKQTS